MDESDEAAQFARRELELAGAESEITTDLRRRIADAADAVQLLIGEADSLRRRVEHVWIKQVGPLSKEHQRRLVTLFPEGIPDDCWLEFEKLSGYDTTVEEPFHILLRVLHNTVPDYPYETRPPI